MAVVISRFDVYLVRLDPAQGAEIRKTRPCVVLSPDEMNASIATVILAPMTTRIRGYPSRVTLRFQGQTGQVALDHLRSVDKQRLLRHLGQVDSQTAGKILETLSAMFAA